MIGWLLVSLALAGCEGRPRPAEPIVGGGSESEPHLAVIDLRRGLPELSVGSILRGPSPTSFSHLVLALREIEDDDHVEGVLVRLGVASIGLARASEIGRRLGALREGGLPVICHADGYQNGTLLLAAQGCDEIWISPAGMVESVGLAGQLLFGHALLERLEIDVDYVQVGKYKGASEPFTRNEPSPEARSSLKKALGELRRAWLDTIAGARGADAHALRLEGGPHTASHAKSLGLVDEVGFERRARERALEKAGVEDSTSRFGKRSPGAGLGELLRLLGGGEGMGMPHVAVVRATGGITLGRSGGILSGPDGISERALTRRLRDLEKDDAVVAVVLRIDSPGGSALASDLLWKALTRLHEEKPLVVSIGDMAASGAYYMACAGTEVVAERTSIVGSIGVVAGKLSFARSLEEIGVHVETVPAGPEGSDRALYGSPLHPWSEETRAKIRSAIEHQYDLFLRRIATGRGLDRSAIEPYAEGRLMGGQRAVDGELVDEIGGLNRAIERAIELADADDRTRVRIVRDGDALLSALGSPGVPNAATLARLEARAVARAERRASRALWGPLRPFLPEIRSFVTSAQPLLEGEPVLAALPFALVVR